MSKTTVRKSLEQFDAAELRQLIFDLYAKSKEAKEILDFYAVPDIAKKLEEYKKPIAKEVWRYSRRAYRPRMQRIRSAIRKFAVLDPGDEAVGQLMVFTIMEFCHMAANETLKDTTNEAVNKFFTETLTYLDTRMMLDEYEPQLAKAIREMNDFRYYSNPLKRHLYETLSRHLENRQQR